MAGLNSFGVFAIDKLPLFLGHKLPKVRSSTAEALYMVLQGSDLDVDESVEELLLQTTWFVKHVAPRAAPLTIP